MHKKVFQLLVCSVLRTRVTHGLLACLFVSACGLNVRAGTPLGGMTVAISPDGKTLVASGDPRAAYVLDPETLAVKERFWVQTSVTELGFSKDGSTLIVADSSDEVRLYSVADWSLKTTVSGVQNFCTSLNGDLFAGYLIRDNVLRIFSNVDGSEKSRIPVEEKIRIAALGFNADGTKIAVLLQGADDESETKVSYGDIPKDLKGLDKELFEQKNDGKTSRLWVYDVASGAVETELTTFYQTSGTTRLGFDGDAVMVINYSNDNATIAPDGTVELFEMPGSFNYGMALSPDQTVFAGGSLATGAIRHFGDGSTAEFKIEKLPGWPEYFKGFCFAPDGTIYGATSANRVVKTSATGEILALEPVF